MHRSAAETAHPQSQRSSHYDRRVHRKMKNKGIAQDNAVPHPEWQAFGRAKRHAVSVGANACRKRASALLASSTMR
jgi:hypothetical protein